MFQAISGYSNYFVIEQMNSSRTTARKLKGAYIHRVDNHRSVGPDEIKMMVKPDQGLRDHQDGIILAVNPRIATLAVQPYDRINRYRGLTGQLYRSHK